MTDPRDAQPTDAAPKDENVAPASGTVPDPGPDMEGGPGAVQRELAAERASYTGAARWLIAIGTVVGTAVAINQLFNLHAFGYVLLSSMYLYVLAAIFLSMTFICFRARGPASTRVPWYDWLLAAIGLVTCGYFAATANASLMGGWEYAPPATATWVSVVLYLLILEATRRTGGTVLFIIVAIFSLYPTFASHIPDPLSGFQRPFLAVIPFFMISSEASFGIPMGAFGSLVIGFILFGAILQFTGGGKFFNDLALALVGGYRGGAAKVAVFASGFMGSMSGSVISNVLTTGAVSIPAMKATGFSRRYAGATEACASTGGVLMPPIMGATAFVMASWLARPYIEIALAAAIPSLLYYFGLFCQVDAYSARRGLKGMARDILPGVWATMKTGWIYLLVFAVLIFLMVAFRWETKAPFWAILLLLIINQIKRGHRFTLKTFIDMLVSVGRTLAELTAILLGIGLIVGAFQATGLTGPLATELIFMAGDSVFMLLVMGALTSFIFGMGMTVTACYIFLAVVLAPALVQSGLNELAVHLFILYWGMVSYITPPVALGAYAAASMAGGSAMKTGFEAMRLGAVLYIVPFFFVLNPALIGEGPAWEVILVLACAMVGIWWFSAAMQGFLAGVGPFPGSPLAYAMRLLLACAALMVASPAGGIWGLNAVEVTLLGFAVALLPIAYLRWATRAPDPASA